MPAVPPVFQLLLPEIILIAGASIVLIAGLSRSLRQSSMALSLIYVLGAIYAAWRLSDPRFTAQAFGVSALNHGPLVWYVRLVTLSVGALILLVNRHVPEETERGEFFALILFSLAGVLLVALANNFVLLFLALELVSVPTYILIGLSRRNLRAQEATAKYFFLGAFAAAMTLYGFSFLYGASGTLQMFGPGGMAFWFAAELGAGHQPMSDPLLLVGLLLAVGGLGFKVAAVPLHFYAPDVYQGAASPITGMLGFVPKFAGFIAIIRLLSLCHWQYGDAVFWLLWGLAAATMTVGNTLALMQHNAKRMLAYSSIAHTGYMLVALAAGPFAGRSGLSALLFYMAVYGVMNLGAFAALACFRKIGDDGEEDSAEQVDDLAGVARRHPWAALALAICVLGLMGFPLTGGFVGKFSLLVSALSAQAASAGPRHGAMLVLVVIAVVNAAIAAAYYLRILASCYLGKPAPGIVPTKCHALRVSLGLCALLVLALFMWPGTLMNASQDAVRRASRNASVPAVALDGAARRENDGRLMERKADRGSKGRAD
ncbi:MAG: NADH-quinone oxidoreductase subunit N [Phycisphaerae bacterium]